MSTNCLVGQLEKLIEHFQRYEDVEKLASKIVATLPGPFTGLVFEKNRFIPVLPPEVPVTSKRASNARLREAVRYLVRCYWYAGITREIPIDMIELALDYNRDIDKRPVPDTLSGVIRELTQRVVEEFRRQGLTCACEACSNDFDAGEFNVHNTLYTLSVSRDEPGIQQALVLLLNFFSNREYYPNTHAVGIINPVTGYTYTLPILGVSKDRAYQHNLLHDILAR